MTETPTVDDPGDAIAAPTPSQKLVSDAIGDALAGIDLSGCPALKSPARLRPREKARMLRTAQLLQSRGDVLIGLSKDDELAAEAIDLIADLDEALEPMAENPLEWEQFVTSPRALTHLPALFGDYMAKMGESMRSAD